MRVDRILNYRLSAVQPLTVTKSGLGLKAEIPVPRGCCNLSVEIHQQVSRRRQFVNVYVNRVRGRDVLKAQEQFDRFETTRGRRVVYLSEGRQLRGESKITVAEPIIERLNTKMVPGHE